MEASCTIGQEQQSRYIVVPLHCSGFLPGLSGKVCKKIYRNRKAMFIQRTDLENIFIYKKTSLLLKIFSRSMSFLLHFNGIHDYWRLF